MFQVVGKLETKHNSLTVSVKRHKEQRKVVNLTRKASIVQIETPQTTMGTPVRTPSPRKIPATLSHTPVASLKSPTVPSWKPQASPISQLATRSVQKTGKVERKYWCFPCNIAYSYRNLLLAHLNTVHDVALLKCDFCSEHFADSSFRERHITEVHVRFPTEIPQQISTEETNEQTEEMYDEEVEWLEDNDEDYEVKVDTTDPLNYEEDIAEAPPQSQVGIQNKELTPLIEKLRMKSRESMFGNKKGRPTRTMLMDWKKRRLQSRGTGEEGEDVKEGESVEEEWWAKPKEIPDPKKYALKDRARMCHICGEMKSNLNAHMRKAHSNFKNCPNCTRRIYESDPTPHKCFIRRPTYLCSCGEEYNIKEHMHGHLLDKNSPKHEIQCPHCVETFRDFQLYHEHQEESHPSPFLCNVCGKQFNKKNNLKSHMYSIHVVEKPLVKCEICGTECKGEQNLKRHVLYVHRKATRTNCEICKISIFDKMSLRRHMKYKHGLKKEFICNVCKKDFATADALRYHLTIHTGLRPYPCPFCPKTFKINSELRKHYRAHKELTIKCPSCSLYCLNEEDLRMHIRRYPSHDVTHVYVEEGEEMDE